MSAPFAPKGDESIRDLCVRLVMLLKPGDRILYSEVMDEGDCELSVAQGAMNAARAVLEKQHHRTVLTVTNVGWQVAHPGELLSVITARQKKTRRAGGRSSRVVGAAHAVRDQIPHEMRKDLDELAAQQRVMDLALRKRRPTTEEIQEAAKRTAPTALDAAREQNARQ